jgi:cytochrome c biogenesis protein CcdA
VALFFGLINIKDYFWYKEGLSFTISDEKKPGIYKGIRKVMQADESIWVLIGSTIVLAAGVSLVEFSCTAGFPVIWTNLLNAQQVSNLAFVGFLIVYMFIYQIDELGIFLVSVFTLRQSKLEEKHGRILKLLGGMLMLTLSAVMLINPALMNNLQNALIIFGIAFGLTGLVLLIHRVILPKFNIWIGTKD